jgi:ABC-2 type transport system permease protein
VFTAIAAFESKYHLKGFLFYIVLAVYFLLSFAAVTSDQVTLGGAVGNVNRNAPYVIMQLLLVMSIFGVFTTTAFVANAVHRDFELGTDALFFSSPIKKFQFLAGRFIGSFTVAVMVYLGVLLAVMVGSLMPWIDKARLGPFEPWPYVYSLFVMIVPNLLLAGAIFFAVAALTRSLMATYASAVAFLVAYAVAGTMLENIENEALAGLLDPFGFGAFSLGTRYWTIFQKNTQVLPLEGIYLWNRVLWVGVALLILAFAFWRFELTTGVRTSKRKKRIAAENAEPMDRISLALPRVSQKFGGISAWKQYFASIRLESLLIFKGIPFLIMLVLGVLNIWGNSSSLNDRFGTAVYPTTSSMVEVIAGASLFTMLIVAFYAGDIVWRERNLRMNEVVDAMTLPTWAQWLAKFSAVMVVGAATLVTGIVTGMVIQTAKRYYNYELDVYAKGVLVELGGTIFFIAALSFILQVLFNQKYVAFLGVLVWFILNPAMRAMGYEHRLYRYAATPPATWSDMNGYGHFAWPLTMFHTYWLLFVALLLVFCHLLWVRGTDGGSLRPRLSVARQRFSKPVALALVASLAGFAATGCYIYYNTNVLNEYSTTKDNEELQATAEKKYKKFEHALKPRITAVQADVQIFPERRAVDIRGQYTMVNKTGKPLTEMHVAVNPQTLTKWKIEIPGARLKSDDRQLGYMIYTFDQPFAPGATLPMKFETGYAARGFVNGDANNNVVANGTFINSTAYFPHLGYDSGIELQDRNKRRKYGLGEPQRLAPPTDMRARMDNGLNNESDWVSLDTTVSTSSDQIALAPGYLQREWTENGRRHFHYKTTSPILGFWSYLSARYTVKRDKWRDVPIEIYYDAKHGYNVDRMIDATKKSLDYFTKNFSPYQHKQVRILEFPGYASFAQSFPNTIPYSETIGFVADLRDPEESIDYVFYVTAHEVAHQWWAHQVIGGNVQGSTMIVESMAQYSALMVMEKEYGQAKMQKFLRYELDRYLRGRGSELIAEKPISLVENQQYIHYGKGSVVMYALRDAIGEDAVNRACRKFIAAHAFDQPPYTTAQELVRYFRAEAPPEAQNFITDLFERIVLFDNQAREVSATKRADGKYVVKMTVASTKLQSDAKGEEKPVPVNDLIDIGVLGEKDAVLFTEKRRITKPLETFEVVVSGKPVKAGIDPFNKLIDRNPKDNTKSF